MWPKIRDNLPPSNDVAVLDLSIRLATCRSKHIPMPGRLHCGRLRLHVVSPGLPPRTGDPDHNDDIQYVYI
jgi:hypothetical protein